MNAIDTNVLVYAVSTDEPTRKPAAVALIESLSFRNTVLLWQVACEFGAVVSRLQQRGRASEEAFEAAALLRARFPVVLPSVHVLDRGMELHRKEQVSYWDAMLLAACEDAGVALLYSEDCQSSPRVAGVDIVNPFKAA